MPDFRRVVEVRGTTEGSGFLIGPGLILTAWHVVRPLAGAPPPETVQVRILGDYRAAEGTDRLRTRPARLLWPMDEPGEDHDFALLLVTDGPTGPGDNSVPWADLPASGEIRVEALGLPNFAIFENRELEAAGRTPFRERDTHAVAGTVSPGSGTKAREAYGRGTFDIVLRPETLPEGAAIGWEGMSGAAVFAGSGLVGVIRDAAEARTMHRLKALPVERLFRRDDVREALRRAGLAIPLQAESAVDVGEIMRVMSTLRMRRGYRNITAAEVARRPTALVVADYGVVPYDDSRDLLGRPGDGRLDTLLGWATTGGGTWVRLMHAPGGQGKTRLALEAVARLNDDLGQTWYAGLLGHTHLDAALAFGPGSLSALLERRGTAGVFFAIDYAETRPDQVRRLAEVLAEAPPGSPIRVLLLARTDGWWKGCLDAIKTVARDLFEDAPVAGAGEAVEVQAQRDFFEAACATFAHRLGAVAREPGVPPLVVADWASRAAEPGRDGSPLDLCLRAYLRIRGVGVAGSPLATMAKEERIHLRRALRSELRDDPREPVVELAFRGAAGLTLLWGLSPAQGDNALRRLIEMVAPAGRPITELEQDAVAAALRSVYGAEVGALRPILPDLLGEQVVGEALADVPTLLPTLLDAFPEDQVHVLILLNRITRRAEGDTTVHDDTIVVRPARAALQSALGPRLTAISFDKGLIIAALAEEGAIQEDVLAALSGLGSAARGAAARTITDAAAALLSANAIPVRLRGFLGAVARDAADMAAVGDDEAGLAERAQRANSQGTFLSNTGWREEALTATEEAVELYRKLVGRNRDAFLPNLAMALNNLGNRLSDLGRQEEALAVTEEAVELYRKLVGRNRDAFLTSLAGALSNLGNTLSDLGQWEEALAASEEAVELYRELVGRNRGVFLHDLAMALSNLGNRLSGLGRREEALTMTEEALRLCRELVERNRDTFLPDLAMTLSNLGRMLSGLGQWEEALAATEEAVELYRKLVGRNRDAFLPNLGRALSNLGNTLSGLGRREEALAATEEAVKLYRELVGRNRDAFLPSLAMTLNNLGKTLSDFGQREEALTATEEAVELYRELVGRNRDAFLPNLAMALNNIGSMLSGLGQWEEALTATEEAVEFCRELVRRNRDAFLHDLAMVFSNLGNRLSGLGQWEEALAATEEAVELYRELVGRNRDAFLPDLAMTLNNLGNRLSGLGQWKEALAATEEAVELYRELVGRNRDAFLPDLAMTLNNLGNTLSELSRWEDALAATEKAVELYRELVGRNRDVFLHDLAGALNNLGSMLSDLGRREDALAATEEAVELYRKLVGRNHDAFLPSLAMALGARGRALLAARRPGDAAECFKEGALLLRPAAAAQPKAFASLFQTLVKHLVRALDVAGRASEIAGTLAELGLGPEAPSRG